MWKNFPLFPERASALAGQVDGLYFFLIAVSAFFTVLIFATIFVFAIRYRKDKHAHPVQIEGSLPLELTWTLIPLGICMIFFAWGSLIYFQEGRAPRGAMEVYAVGKQWMWKFEHETGQREINQLHVPIGRDVKMIMSSQDVIHSFFVPAFRIKADVLPGRYTTTWFHPTKTGTYHLFCAEYCGTQHSGMIGEVVVMEPTAYQAWLSSGGATGSLPANGQQIFQQLGCATCHRADTKAADRTWLAYSASRCCLRTAGQLSPTRITSGSPFLIPRRRWYRDSSRSCRPSRDRYRRRAWRRWSPTSSHWRSRNRAKQVPRLR